MLQTAEGEGQCSVTHFSALRLHLAQKEALRGDHSKRRGIHSGFWGNLEFSREAETFILQGITLTSRVTRHLNFMIPKSVLYLGTFI